MKLPGNDPKVKTLALGDMNAKEFGIDTSNGVIFDILRNKMYSNKIAAVAREITSNSRDANRENKKTDVPIEIEIVEPNVFLSSTDMQIMFKDKGTGITPDRMANIFLNYGASTKRNTNKQTGGFGLGAKTPFAYTDTFTVVTVYKTPTGNVKDTYTASITDRSGKGSGEMILFNSEETKEDTGTMIVVPIRESDRAEFEREVHRATAFWKVKPVLKGFETQSWKFKEVFKGTGFNIIEDIEDRFSNRYLVVLDGIPYEVDRGVLNLDSGFLHGTDLILCYHYNNGELTVSANREALQYDRGTKTKLLWKIRQVKNAFLAEIQKKADECKTYIEACILYNKAKGEIHDSDTKSVLLREIFRSNDILPKGFKITFNGKAAISAPNIKWHELTLYTNYDSNGKLSGRRMNVAKFDEFWRKPAYWLDAAKRDTRKNATLIDNGGFILMTSNVIELKEGKDPAQEKAYKETYDKFIQEQKEEKEYIESLGLTIGMYSTVVQKVMPKDARTEYYRKTNEVSVSVRRVTNGYLKSDWPSRELTYLRNEKTTKDGVSYIYFVTNKLSYLNDYTDGSILMPEGNLMEKGRIAAHLLKTDFVFVGEKSGQYLIDDVNMMTIEEAWNKVMADPALVAKMVQAKNQLVVDNLSISDKWALLNVESRVTPETFLAVKMSRVKKYNRNRVDVLVDYNYLNEIKEIKPTITVDGVKKELKGIEEKYPMLRMFVQGCTSDSSAKDINLIMDTFDAAEKAKKNVRKITAKARLREKLQSRNKRSKFN